MDANTRILLSVLLACGLGAGVPAQGEKEPPKAVEQGGVAGPGDQGAVQPGVDPGLEAGVVQPVGEDWKDGEGNDWFDMTKRHLGTLFQEEEAKGQFKFENPRKKTHKLYNLMPSCTCSNARITIGDRVYEVGADKVLNKIETVDGIETKTRVEHINVEPGDKGVVDVKMTMDGVQGDKDADLQIMTSDLKLPVINLRWRATGATFFVAEPPEINLNEMTWTDKREFQFTVYSPLKEDFEILSHGKLSKSMKISYEKGKRPDGRTQWTVKGSYGPGADESESGGQILLTTDLEGKTVTVNVAAFLKGPLEVKPGGFIGIGRISSKEGKSIDIELIPTGEFDLKVEKVELARINVREDRQKYLHFDTSKDGKNAKVTIRIEKGMPAGYITGTLKLHLNHPAAKLKEVMFNGFVR